MSALGDHAMAAHTREFREKLSPMVGALYDEGPAVVRLRRLMSVMPG